jgi:hypothetical protein
MNCPQCGREMREGYVHSLFHPVIWSEKPIADFAMDVDQHKPNPMLLEGWSCKHCSFILAKCHH